MQISLEGKVAIVTGVSGDGQVGQAVAQTVVFLASPAASGITGQVIAVTGWGL